MRPGSRGCRIWPRSLRLKESEDPASTGAAGVSEGTLERRLCQVGGLNQNYVSAAGTLYHIQIEDRGPLEDSLTEATMRRVNVVVYANYGEPNASILYSHDHDFDDIRSKQHNAFISAEIQRVSKEARGIIEDMESQRVTRVKALLRSYYETKDEATKREFEAANAAFPFVFSKAWRELKSERAKGMATPEGGAPTASLPPSDAASEETVYPLDPGLRENVLEIEKMIAELERDVGALKARGIADDILLQTCRKLIARARQSISGSGGSQFSDRRLDMMRKSLRTTWRQVRSRLKAR